MKFSIIGKAIGSEIFPFLLGLGYIFLLVLFIGLYVYHSFAWMTIAKKLKYKKPWLAWIPIVQLFLLPILAKKHWTYGFLFLIPLVNIVFIVICLWKIFERRKYPGELSLVFAAVMVPFVNIFVLIPVLIIVGLVAWYDIK
ncbi:MAG: hypothetical protein NZ889_01030 [Candidatus Pacearchaeota archaeon]|nr:hypothetical protein [Candidatus Pacearchaeota archaeon]